MDFLGITVTQNDALVTAGAEIALGLVLVLGLLVVRRGRVRLHMYLQSAVVLVNLPIALLAMLPPYLDYVWPGLPADLGQSFYLYPTIMLVAGLLAEGLGLYIVLVAATSWLPERLRFRRYKLVMRTELILWWAVLLTGLGTYYVWYVQP